MTPAPARVCLYTESHAFGGAEQVLLDLLTRLDRGRWEPLLLCQAGPDTDRLRQSACELGATIVSVPPLPDGTDGARRFPRWMRMLRSLRPAVFHAQLSWPMEAKFALTGAIAVRIPAITGRVCSFPEFQSSASARLQRRVIARSLGKVVAVSAHVARELERVLGWPSSKIQVVHSGVDERMFDVEPDQRLRDELHRGSRRSIVLAVARLDPAKGLDILIDAGVHLPNTQIVIAGEGPDRARLVRHALRTGVADRVTLLGHRTDVARLLASCDVLALPSLNEALGKALLEAMAAGRPVVASDVGGVAELVADGETGILVPPGNAAALASAIDTVLRDKSLASAMGAAGRRRVRKRFGADRSAEAITSIWRDLIERRRVT